MTNVGASKRSRRFRELEQRLASGTPRSIRRETNIAPTKAESDTDPEERVSSFLEESLKEQEIQQEQKDHLEFFKWSFDENYIKDKRVTDPKERYNAALRQTTSYLGYNFHINKDQVRKLRSFFLTKYPFAT